MQGRLAEAPNNDDLDWFPAQSWEEEFDLAKEIGFGSIELVFDRGCISSNPLRTKVGRDKLRKEFFEHGLIPYSCCLNFIIDSSIKNSDVFAMCEESLGFLKEVGINVAILPLFNKSDFKASDIKNELTKLATVAERHNIKILIESNESASNILKFLNCIASPNVGVVYDIGNASVCGHDVKEELFLLREKLVHIHIKDKTRSGNNVLLGSGIVNFSKVFRSISEIKYQGMFTLETYKGENSLISAKRNLEFLQEYMMSFGLETDYEI
jgi:sugar phosphate isomerase/epimerase